MLENDIVKIGDFGLSIKQGINSSDGGEDHLHHEDEIQA